MAIRAPNNLYRGINAHLHSILQNEPGDWESFHAAHIADLRSALERQLPPFYVARGERGLQIRETGEENGSPGGGRTVPDVTIYQLGATSRDNLPIDEGISSPTITIPVAETLARLEDDYLTSIVIYEIEGGRLGRPVTRIELFSPANKPPKSGYRQYLRKRDETLKGGMRLVEVDYLHQSRSPVPNVPDYTSHNADTTPYTIIVSDPRPSLDIGKTFVYGFHVDDPLPVVTIPLSGNDHINFDFGAVYNYSYNEQRYHYFIVDYAELPEKFDTYSPFDQERIRQVMARVAANPPGHDL